jgi:carbonic anhydrase
LENIRSQSVILKEMEEKGEIVIVGAMYDISDGKVTYI